jgi:hypothetical protein
MLIMSSGYCSINLYLSFSGWVCCVLCSVICGILCDRTNHTLSVGNINKWKCERRWRVLYPLYRKFLTRLEVMQPTIFLCLNCARHLDEVLKVFRTCRHGGILCHARNTRFWGGNNNEQVEKIALFMNMY